MVWLESLAFHGPIPESHAEAMLIAYNAKNKYRLPIKKLYGSQHDEGLDDEETDDDTAAI